MRKLTRAALLGFGLVCPASSQVQTNSRSTGLNTHWMDVPDATATNQMNFTIDPANDGVYYRLVYP